MANPLRGEVAFKLDGEDFTFALDINRLCELEDMFPGQAASDLVGLVGSGRMKVMRAFWWAGLQDYKLTLADAGVWLQRMTPSKAGKIILECAVKAFPKGADEPAAGEGGEGQADPT